jgi:CBS domain-containing protein
MSRGHSAGTVGAAGTNTPTRSSRLRQPRPRISRPRPLEGPVFFYNATARDIMTRKVATVRKDASLLEALDIMRVRDVSGLPVVDAGGKVVGVLSERDVGRAAARRGEIDRVEGGLELLLAYLLRQPEATLKKIREILGGQRVDRVMSRRVYSVSPDATLETVVHELVKHHVHRLPVLEGGKLVGIVTRDDVLARGTFRYPAGVVEAPEFAPESAAREARRTV